MNQKLVSIIIPVFNGENFIRRTVITLQNQGYQNWEAIFVDDCSTDQSVVILESIADERIRIIKLDVNSGPAVARNVAIEAARGRFIAFLDSDDVWEPNKLELQLSFMRIKKHSFTYHWHQKVDEELGFIRLFKPEDGLTFRKLLRYNPLHTSSVIYDSQALGKIYMPEIRKRQDYGLWFRLVEKCEGRCLPELLSSYVQREGSVSSNKLSLFKFNWQLYREAQGFSIPLSLYCLSWAVFSKLLKIK
jgi:glycosyltransferase involved in cell wall biosynthesis